MKIFSLETKWHIVIWALILGLFINLVMFVLSQQKITTHCPDNANCWPVEQKMEFGWPFEIHHNNLYDYYFEPSVINMVVNEYRTTLNIFSSFIIFLIILSTVKFFKKKNSEMQVKENKGVQ